jgi:Family of unknown function (DUF6399)
MSVVHSTVASAAPPAVYSRTQIARLLDQHDLQAQQQPTSQHQFARQHLLPRTTLQYWLQRRQRLHADPALVAFFESEPGLSFLHSLHVAAHLVFVQQGACGLRLLSSFWRLSGLDAFLASSFSPQQRFALAMEHAIVRFANEQRSLLAAAMPKRTIALCEDETFHRFVCLVGLEPVSGFLLLECYADNREAKTWTEKVKAAKEGLSVQIVQSVSDEAKGIKAHAEAGLGAPHAPDVFHVQHEVCKGTFPTLAKQVRRAQELVTEAGRRLAALPAAGAQRPAEQSEAARPSPAALAGAEHERCQQELSACKRRQETMREAVRGVSASYHPFDLQTGAGRTAEEVEKALAEEFEQMKGVAEEALPVRCRERIAKARRALPGLVAAVAFFWLRVRAALEEQPQAWQQVLREQLLAGQYLLLVAGKAKTAEERARLRALGESYQKKAEKPKEATEKEWEQMQVLAKEMARWFVRGSSCVEGRNGQLRSRYQSGRGLSTRKLAVLTSLHNYWITRADGTTAAQRFFGQKHADLFQSLLQQLPLPARPAQRRKAA